VKITEFYPRRQGRPMTPELIDLETGQGSLYFQYLFFKEEYDKMEETLDRLLNKGIEQMYQQLVELQQIKLHLASLSDENIDEKDVEVE